MEKTIELWQYHDAGGSRKLTASILPSGDLRFDGLDYGDGVESAFGAGLREYEYALTVQAADVPLLAAALGDEANLLQALETYFHQQAPAGPKTFLDERQIPYDFWSRVGD